VYDDGRVGKEIYHLSDTESYTVSFEYDAFGRLESLTATDPGGTPLLNYAYTHDEVGNLLTKNHRTWELYLRI
jgi:YD repeat-containing protein